jgi:hypothetical protein
MSLEILLSRLEKVKGRNGNFTACCPAHSDRNPSMAIREQDGKVILHCFAGCEVAAIVAAVGMDMTDLFPPRQVDYAKSQPKVRFFASDLLKLIQFETQVVMVAAYAMAKGEPLPETDKARLKLAYERINDALEATQ